MLSSFVSEVSLAAGEGHHGGHEGGELHINWWGWDMEVPPVGWFLLDFALFAFLLVRFMRKPLRSAFQKRHESIKHAIAENAVALQKAKSAAEESRQKLAAVDAEVGALIQRIKEDGGFERDRIINGARDYSKRMQADTKTLLEHEAGAAQKRLLRVVAAEALMKAEKLIAATLTAADRERLVEDAIGQIERDGAQAHPKEKRKKSRGTEDAGEAA